MTRTFRLPVRISTLALGVALTMLLVLVGCSGSDDTTAAQDTSGSTSQPAAQPTQVMEKAEDKGPVLTPDQQAVTALPGYRAEWGTPQYGGTLLHGQPWPFLNTDEPLGAVLYNRHTSPRYNQIIRVDPWGDVSTLEGDLAESWGLSADGMTLTIKLIEGVMFHDGTPMTCADAEYSTESYIDPRKGLTTWGKSMLTHVTDVSCADSHTLVITMDKVVGSTMSTLGSGTLRVVKKDALQALDAAGGGASRGQRSLQQTIDSGWTMDGTGPYIFDSFEPDIIVKIKKNPNYFKDGLPLLDEVHDVQILDSTARFAALTAGKIHQAGEGSSSLLPAQVQQVRSRFKDKVVLSWTGSPGQQGFSYNQSRPPFDDFRVRKALDLVLDRNAWMKIQGADENLLFGNARISGLQATGTYWSMSDAEIYALPGYRQPKAQDIEEARRLLKEAGYENGFEASCMTRTAQNYMDVCLFGIEQWRTTLGLDIKTRFLEPAASTEASLACNYDIQVTWSSGTQPIQDPDYTLWRAFSTESNGSGADCERVFPGTAYQAEIDKLTGNILATLDPVKKKQLARDVEISLLLDSIPYSGIGWTMYNYGNAPEVRGANWYNYGTYIYHVMPERMWLSDDGERWWEGFYATHAG